MPAPVSPSGLPPVSDVERLRNQNLEKIDEEAKQQAREERRAPPPEGTTVDILA